MKIQDLKEKWPLYLSMIIVNALILFAIGCPAKTKSLTTPGKKVTRPELQLEFDTFIMTADIRMADLDQQDKIRNIVLKNALIMIETGTFNPLGIATALFAFYGIGNAGAKTVSAIKKVKNGKNTV